MEYIIYCRKSTDESTEKQVQSIPDQMRECVERAQEKGLTIAKRPKDFSDFETEEEIKKQDKDDNPYSRSLYKKYRGMFIVKEQKTAKEPGVRKKRVKLMKLVEQGKIEGIISYHPDRQARNMEEGGQLITHVDKGYLDLKYPRFHFEPSATGKMMLGFLFVFSKNYSDTISENVRRGNETTIARGKALGRNKHGYIINDEGYYMPDGKNFELMQEAFRMKIYEKQTNEQIGNRLTIRGFEKALNKGKKGGINIHNLGRIRQDPFYYGLHIHGHSQTDLTQSNPHFKPMITEQEYIQLSTIIRDNFRENPRERREENDAINPLSKGLITTADGTHLSYDIPNKGRHLAKLKKLHAEGKLATLEDVITPKSIYYEVKKKESQHYGLRVSYAEVEKEVLALLRKVRVNDEAFESVKLFMQDKFQKEQDLKAEKMRMLQNQRNLFQSKLDNFIKANLGNNRDVAEEKVYQAEKNKQLEIIDSIDREMTNSTINERNYVAECEAFIGVFRDAASRFKKLKNVRKKEFIQVFISNIIVNKKRQVSIKPFPYIEGLLVSHGAEYEGRTRNLVLGKDAL